MENLFGSICLSDIPVELIRTSEKNGKKYISVVIGSRRETSKFGYTHYIKVYAKRGEVADGVNLFIGDAKPSVYQDADQPAPAPAPTAQPAANDGLPF